MSGAIFRDIPAWLGWAWGAVMTVVNIILGYIVIPMRGDLEALKCAVGERDKELFYLKNETARQDKELCRINGKLSEINDRTIRTETKVDGIAESIAEIKKSLR